MKNITVILPIHKIEGDYKLMLDNAIKSIEPFQNDVFLTIVCPTSLKSELDGLSEVLDVKIISNSGSSDFISQVLVPTEKVVQVKDGKKISKDKVYFPGYVMIEANLVGEIPHIIKSI